MTNTMNTPAEALEYAYPLRVLRYEIARGTGGHGKHRGGSGLHRDLAVLCEAEGSLLTERREIAPYGLAGGGPGRPGRNRQRSGRRTRALPGKVELKLAAGDQLLVQTPGGGGWGRSERSPARD